MSYEFRELASGPPAADQDPSDHGPAIFELSDGRFLLIGREVNAAIDAETARLREEGVPCGRGEGESAVVIPRAVFEAAFGISPQDPPPEQT